MQHAQLTETVRTLVAHRFNELGIDDPEQFRETILIRGGNYCGRRFETAAGHAIWFVEENQIKFYNAAGKMLCALQPQSQLQTARFAA